MQLSPPSKAEKLRWLKLKTSKLYSEIDFDLCALQYKMEGLSWVQQTRAVQDVLGADKLVCYVIVECYFD